MKKILSIVIVALLGTFTLTQCVVDNEINLPQNENIVFNITFKGLTLDLNYAGKNAASKTNETSTWIHIFEENLALNLRIPRQDQLTP